VPLSVSVSVSVSVFVASQSWRRTSAGAALRGGGGPGASRRRRARSRSCTPRCDTSPHACLPACLPLPVPAYLSLHVCLLTSACLSNHPPPACLSVYCLHACLSTVFCVLSTIYMPVCLSTSLSTYLPVCIPAGPSSSVLSTCAHFHMLACSVCLFGVGVDTCAHYCVGFYANMFLISDAACE
jgi:hypothetical protein